MQSTMMILTTLLASGALASPFLAGRGQMCSKVPTAPHSDDFAPFSQPFGPSADVCHQHCQADQNCHSFVCGFSPSAQAPKCMLFHVPGWQVPGQEDDLHVFDRDCEGVPTGRPSKQDHMGEHHSNEEQGPHKQTGPGKDHDHNKHDSNPSPPAASHAPSPPNGGHHQRDVAHKCGGAPSGHDGNAPAPAPMRTHNDVDSEKDCLSLCKKTDGCKAVEFGKPSPKAVHECRLFSVEADRLPAPGSDQSFTAFDSAC
ncbi:hypothetical protein VSDG_01815 [Cytospora chrysosperma]|uniref:Apple domain-containing protein n=1 Tax=Cytospora chrysosperma TaxID=252740 RepID=A0A423WH16_CYTCH|nr:hypothetical protein VSDG_01815 [Valsa sordida]